jgi:hypothetical protein
VADTEKHDDEDGEREGAHADEPDGDKAEGESGHDEAAQRVAEALGVDGGEGEGEGAAPAEGAEAEAEAVQNRAARRREAARKRRKKAAASEGTSAARAGDEDDDDLPADRNKRAKELLKRRREQAGEGGGSRPVALLPSEMVDDALSRSASAASRWIRKNFSAIQWVVAAAVVGGIGFAVWTWRGEKTSAEASDALAEGVAAERGQVMAEDKRPDDQKEIDPTKVFKTEDEKDQTALAAYKKVIDQHPNTGPALLAKLGEAGVYLEKRDWPNALDRYSAVSSSNLAGADPDVKGRALEGLGLAKEGKGDIDGALSTFKELEAVDARGFKELAMYHQGRLLLKKGDKDAAKDVLKKARDLLQVPGPDGKKLQYLSTVVDESLREIDPALVPTTHAAPMGGAKGNSLSPEDLKKYVEKREQMSKQKKDGDHH